MSYFLGNFWALFLSSSWDRVFQPLRVRLCALPPSSLRLPDSQRPVPVSEVCCLLLLAHCGLHPQGSSLLLYGAGPAGPRVLGRPMGVEQAAPGFPGASGIPAGDPGAEGALLEVWRAGSWVRTVPTPPPGHGRQRPHGTSRSHHVSSPVSGEPGPGGEGRLCPRGGGRLGARRGPTGPCRGPADSLPLPSTGPAEPTSPEPRRPPLWCRPPLGCFCSSRAPGLQKAC